MYIGSTHGTNAYDFNLMTAIVIDEYGEYGIPVLWAISNRQDTETLTIALKAMKTRTGQVLQRLSVSSLIDLTIVLKIMSTLSSPAVIQGLSLSRNELIKLYFYEGYEYSLIVCFLIAMVFFTSCTG